MKFRKLFLENFRQFYSSNSIEFAVDDNKNVTLIYGANGSGKTTLLNAMTWLFYDKFTSDFEKPNKLINERRWDETKNGSYIDTIVSLEFEHENKVYNAVKTLNIRKTSENKIEDAKDAKLKVSYIDDDGEYIQVKNPKDFLDRLLPERLHSFFFFNGERIDALARDTAYSEIEDAIKSILGLEVVDRSIKHLSGKVKQHFNKKWADEGSESLKIIQEEITNIEEDLENNENELKIKKDNLDALNEIMADLRQKFKDLEKTKLIQEAIEKLDEDLSINKQYLKDLKLSLSKICSEHGYLAFTPKVIKESYLILEEAYKKNEIPSRIKRKFIDELLETHTCICGRQLTPTEEPYKTVEKWRNTAGLDDVEEAAQRTKASIEYIQDTRLKFYEELKDIFNNNKESMDNKKKLEEQLSEKNKEREEILKGQGITSEDNTEKENYQKLLEKLKTTDDSITTTNRDIGNIEERIKSINRQLKEKNDEREKYEAQTVKEELAKKRVKVLTESIKIFQSLYNYRWKDIRRRLDEKIKSIYREISFKSYTPILSEDYHLRLVKQIGNIQEAVPKSTGENQILSLSFIGSLVDYARDIYLNKNPEDRFSFLSFKGGIYTLVIDSPFGTLDTDYRKSIALGIPKLSPQVILMVSKSQGMGVVQEKLLPRVGKAYSLSYFTNKKDYKKNEELSWQDRNYPYITKSFNKYEFAEIEEITNA